MRVRSVTVGTPVPAPALDNRSTKAGASTPATPVPGRDPARHLAGRSTKAGASTPATLDLVDLAPPLGPRRSTKAGASTPATRRCRISRCTRAAALNEGRGFHPGDTSSRGTSRTCPPTLNEGRGFHPGDTSRRRRRRGACRTLNEGRGFHPGDTIRGRHGSVAPVGRSTKAGASTPATRPKPTGS